MGINQLVTSPGILELSGSTEYFSPEMPFFGATHNSDIWRGTGGDGKFLRPSPGLIAGCETGQKRMEMGSNP